jgi:glutaredoxin-related protein
MDKNKDNALDFNELKQWLRESSPYAKERELKWQFHEMDKANRRKINFGDFCDFVYKVEASKGPKKKSLQKSASVVESVDFGFSEKDLQSRVIKTQARLSDMDIIKRLNSPTATEAAGIDWDATSDAFYAYAGSDKLMQGNEFARLCRDCKIFDDKFSSGHAEYIYRRCCAKGENYMRERAFRDAMMLIAKAKDEPAIYIRALVCNAPNQQIAIGKIKDNSSKEMVKSASATGMSDTGTRLPRLSSGSVGLGKVRGLHRRPLSAFDVGS